MQKFREDGGIAADAGGDGSHIGCEGLGQRVGCGLVVEW